MYIVEGVSWLKNEVERSARLKIRRLQTTQIKKEANITDLLTVQINLALTERVHHRNQRRRLVRRNQNLQVARRGFVGEARFDVYGG